VATDIHLTSLLGVNNSPGAIDSFLFLPEKGNIVVNPQTLSAARTIFYKEENGNYIFKLGMIPLKKGIYCFTIVDIYQAMKNCDKISVTILMKNGDSHLHYLKNIYYGGENIYSIDATHSYCFKVY